MKENSNVYIVAIKINFSLHEATEKNGRSILILFEDFLLVPLCCSLQQIHVFFYFYLGKRPFQHMLDFSDESILYPVILSLILDIWALSPM